MLKKWLADSREEAEDEIRELEQVRAELVEALKRTVPAESLKEEIETMREEIEMLKAALADAKSAADEHKVGKCSPRRRSKTSSTWQVKEPLIDMQSIDCTSIEMLVRMPAEVCHTHADACLCKPVYVFISISSACLCMCLYMCTDICLPYRWTGEEASA